MSAAADSEPSDAEQIRAEIDETREELGDTVEALAEKLDVKAQAKAKVDERKDALKEKQQELKDKVADLPQQAREADAEDAKRLAAEVTQSVKKRPGPAIAGGVVVGLLVLRRLARRRSRR